jgi:prepilin-type N-terminal cleavage/methylation domain-containing protein
MMHRYTSRQHGYSITEVLIAIAVSLIVMGFAILNTAGTLDSYKVDSAMDQVVGQMRTGRQTAIASRRNVEIAFTAPNQVQLDPETPTGAQVLPSPYPVATLGYGANFIKFPGVPDTPMGFGGNGTISFDAGGAPPVLPLRFTSAGALMDANNNFTNGTLFVGIPGRPGTARAVTVLGGTGRVRAYYWNGTQWTE